MFDLLRIFASHELLICLKTFYFGWSSSRELTQTKVSTPGDLKKLESKEMALGKTILFSVFLAAPSRALNKKLIAKKETSVDRLINCKSAAGYTKSLHIIIIIFFSLCFSDLNIN